MPAPRDHAGPPVGISDLVRTAVRRCAEGDLPANVALTHLFMVARDEDEARRGLAHEHSRLHGLGDRRAAQRLREASDLWSHRPGAFAATREVLRLVDHTAGPDAGDAVARWSAAFDRVAAVAPRAGVALYALGDPDLLRAATEELVARMRAWDLLGDRAVLDLGCGSGRVLKELASEVRLAIGIDVSIEMLRAARRLCAKHDNVVVLRSSGRDLGCLGDGAFDLVCAIDVFPYLVLGGLAERHLREAVRVLRPGGHLLLLNYSYRGDRERDRSEVAAFARDSGLHIQRDGTRDLALWDGRTFLLRLAA